MRYILRFATRKKWFIEPSDKKKQENKDLVIRAVAENEDIKKIEAHVVELCNSCGIDISTMTSSGVTNFGAKKNWVKTESENANPP